MRLILSLLLWIWQLPQNLLAVIIIKLIYTDTNCYCTKKSYKGVYFYSTVCRSCFMDNFSLGDYIFISSDNWFTKIDIRHSYGYVLSSRILGPLWLPIILIPRVVYAYYDPMGYHLRGYYTETFAKYLIRKKEKGSFSYKCNKN